MGVCVSLFRGYGGVVSIFGKRGCGGHPLSRLEVRDMFLRFFSRLEVFSYPRTFVPPYPPKGSSPVGGGREGASKKKRRFGAYAPPLLQRTFVGELCSVALIQ